MAVTLCVWKGDVFSAFHISLHARHCADRGGFVDPMSSSIEHITLTRTLPYIGDSMHMQVDDVFCDNIDSSS